MKNHNNINNGGTLIVIILGFLLGTLFDQTILIIAGLVLGCTFDLIKKNQNKKIK